MLPILVLALAASAFAAPGVQNVQFNQIPSSNPLGLLFELIDGGDKMLNELNLGQSLKDMASQGNSVQANGQGLTAFAELATGVPGDACDAANYINAYTSYMKTGNAGPVRQALSAFFQALSAKIDNIVALATNRSAVRFASGVRGGCPNGGRTYDFDNAWDVILGSSNNPLGIVQEEFCAAKRLYCAFSVRANNVGAAVTAAALPPSSQVFEHVAKPMSNFLAAAGSKGNLGNAASALKQAISFAVSKVNL